MRSQNPIFKIQHVHPETYSTKCYLIMKWHPITNNFLIDTALTFQLVSFPALDSTHRYGHTSNAFIFSLHNKEGLAPFQANVTAPAQAIYKTSWCGPTFGGGHDIRIADENHLSDTRFGHSYSIPTGVQDPSTILAGSFAFIPDEVEVFYLAPP